MNDNSMNPGRVIGDFVRERDDGRSCHEEISPSLVSINRLLKQRDDLAYLCGEILATLRIPANQSEQIKKLVDTGIIDKWREQYDKFAGNPNKE